MQTQSLTHKTGMQKISVYTITYAHDRNAKDECKHIYLRTWQECKRWMQTQSLTNKIGEQNMNGNTTTYEQDRNAKDECKHNHLLTR